MEEQEPRLINTRYISEYELNFLKYRMRCLWNRFIDASKYIDCSYWTYSDTQEIRLIFRIREKAFIEIVTENTESLELCKWKLKVGNDFVISGKDKDEELINLIKMISED